MEGEKAILCRILMRVYECCGVESVTKKVYCSICRQEIKNEREVPDEGTVYSYTVIHIAPAEYAELAPYVVALVQLKDSKAKLTVRIYGDVQIGDPVQLDQIVDGTYIYKKSNLCLISRLLEKIKLSQQPTFL